MIVRPYTYGDERRVRLQTSQQYMGDYLDALDRESLESLRDMGLVWTCEKNGQIIMIGGLIPIWEERAQVWALIAGDLRSNMIPIHRAVKKFLAKAPYRRIEATVDIGFKEGYRWLKMLGFEIEGYMKAYRPDGGDMMLFARVRR